MRQWSLRSGRQHALFLVSDMSSFVRGSALWADGSNAAVKLCLLNKGNWREGKPQACLVSLFHPPTNAISAQPRSAGNGRIYAGR